MKHRPTSITVISWILIIMGGISLITSTISLNNPMAKELMSRSIMPISIQYLMIYVGLDSVWHCNAQRAELGKTSLCNLEYHWVRYWHRNIADESCNDSWNRNLSNCGILSVPPKGQGLLCWYRGSKWHGK